VSAVLTAQEPSAKYLVNLQPPLVRHFDLIAQALGGVARLRELILTLAVQGKLVPQDPSDEPASELLKKIRAQKDRLIAEGKIKQDKPLAEIADDEKPFELPQGWEWVRLGDVQSFTNGFAFKSTSFADEGVGVVRIGNVHHGEITEKGMVYVPFELSEKVDPQFFIAPDDLVITMTGDVKLGFNKSSNRYLLNQRVGKITPILVHPSYLFFCLELVAEKKIEEASGSVIPNVSTGEINATPFALPPLAEQSRIVTRVEELMQLCDALEASGQLEAQQHAQLVNTLLGTLTQNETPEALADNWQRIATHFDVLLDRPEAVDALEQTILQLAVRGLLVPQDPSDEPASVLLQKVRTEKDHLTAQGKFKRDKPLPPITDEEKPFGLPQGWEWVRLNDLIRIGSGDGLTAAQMAPNGTIPVYGGNGVNGHHDQANVDEPTVVIGRVGYYCGSVHITPASAWVTDNAFITRYPKSYLEMEWLYWLLVGTNLKENDSATAQPVISGRKLYPIVVALPPHLEQSRIVTRINELRSLCADLRERLQSEKSLQVQLASAIIQAR
jgi:type I restriction enzyme, S subunit